MNSNSKKEKIVLKFHEKTDYESQHRGFTVEPCQEEDVRSLGLHQSILSPEDNKSLLRRFIQQKKWTESINILPSMKLERSDLPILVFLLLIAQYQEDLYNSTSILQSVLCMRNQLMPFATLLRQLYSQTKEETDETDETPIRSDDETDGPSVFTSCPTDNALDIQLCFRLNNSSPLSAEEKNILKVNSGSQLWSHENMSLLSSQLLNKDDANVSVLDSAFILSFIEKRLHNEDIRSNEAVPRFCVQSIPIHDKSALVEVWGLRISCLNLCAAYGSDGSVCVINVERQSVRWRLPDFLEVVKSLPQSLTCNEKKSRAAVSTVCWSPCGTYLAIASECVGCILIYSFQSETTLLVGCLQSKHAKRTSGITCLLWPTLSRLCAGGIDGGIWVFDPLTDFKVSDPLNVVCKYKHFISTPSSVTSLSSRSDSPLCFAALVSTSTFILIDIIGDWVKCSPRQLDFQASAMSSSTDNSGRFVLFSLLVDAPTDEERMLDFLSRDSVSDTIPLKTTSSGTVCVYDIEKNSVFSSHNGHLNRRNILEPVFAMKNSTVMIGSEQGELCLWKINLTENDSTPPVEAEPFLRIKHSSGVNASAWTVSKEDDRHLIATACDDGYIHLITS